MPVRLLGAGDAEQYAAWVASHPHGTLWQSSDWKKFQEALGRETRVYVVEADGEIAASATVVIDRTAGNLSTWNIPRGPLWTDMQAAQVLMERLRIAAKADKCLSVYFSPLEILDVRASKVSPRHEQPEATRIVDLTLSEEDILKQMHQKGRYNIKVAQKHGVSIEVSGDAGPFAELMAATAARDGFRAAGTRHYQTFLKTIPGSFLLYARAQGAEQPVAGIIGVRYGQTGIYYYGASDHAHRSLMAPYLLQWEAMRMCKAAGCTAYDLLGVAPPDADEDHPWAGISDFKAKFGGTLVTYPPERELRLKPVASGLLRMKRKILG